MANRGLTASMLSEILKDDIEYFMLVELDFSTPLRYTTAQKDIVFAGDTYASDGNLLALGAVKEEVGVVVPKMSIVLSGANIANIALAFSEDYNNLSVNVYFGCLDDSGDVVADPILIFPGFLDSYSIDDDPDKGKSTVTWIAVDSLGRFETKNGRRNNTSVQQLHFPNDLGLDFANDPTTKLEWGSRASW